MEKAMSRKDLFKKLKAEKEEANTNFQGFENPEYVALSDDEYRLIRLMGNELQSKDHCPTDAHLFKTIFIKGDDGKKMKTILNPDRDHPFNKMVYFLGKGKWIDDENTGKKKKVYDHEGSPSLAIMNSNYHDDGPYPQSWDSPQKYVAINCIDRMDDWCKTNNHTKVLIHSVNVDGDKVYPEIGIKKTLYDIIWEQLCTEYELHFEDFDIAVKRIPTSKDKSKKQTVYFKAVRADRAEKDLIEFGNKIGVDYASRIVAEGAPTDAEYAYEQYNFETMPCFLPTSAKRLYNHIKNFVKKVDTEFGSDYVGDFTAYIEKEEAERKIFWAEYKKAHATEESEDKVTKPASKETTSKETTVSKESVRRSVVKKEEPKKEEPAFDTSELDPEIYTGISKMSDEDKALIIGVDEDSGELKFRADCQLVECANNNGPDDEEGCHFMTPSTYTICPYCAAEFQ